jgi:tRNA(Arg) A34 adenosine deaminase TadA
MARKKYDITAIIYDKKGNVLSVGKNDYLKTHPAQKRFSVAANEPEKLFLHAETLAIIRCKALNKAHSILITRVNNKGVVEAIQPCHICAGALKAVGIHKIL